MVAGWKKFAVVGEKAWHRNGDLELDDDRWDGERCYRCNRPVLDCEKALYVHVVAGGVKVRRPDSPEDEPASDVGLHLIGPTCAKNYPGYAFTMEGWSGADGYEAAKTGIVEDLMEGDWLQHLWHCNLNQNRDSEGCSCGLKKQLERLREALKK